MRLSKANTLRVLYFLFSSCTAAWLPLLADYCKSRGLSGTEIGFILSINPVMMFVVQPLVGMMSDRLGYKKTLLVSSFLASISYIGFLYYDTIFGWLIFVMAFMSLFYNGIQPVLDSLSLQLSRSDKRFSYGSLRIAGAAGWAFTGIIAGQVIDAIDIRVIFIVSAVTMFLFFLFCCLLTIEKHHEEEVLERNPFRYAGTVLRNRQFVFFTRLHFSCLYKWYFDLEFLLPIHEGKRRISKPRGIWIVIPGTLRTTLVLLFGGYHCTTRIEENFDLNGNCYRIATCSVQYCEKSDCCNSDRVTTRGILVAILGGLR